ncbi:MAG: enoyl-CoA hydratase [Dehalococcoidia bacterium]|nr:enoyl-CoA hydratase [Dehalococcoidia bacterium]
MNYEEILYEVQDNTAVITFNRPARLNAWTKTIENEYRDALKRADADAGVRSIILTGAGRGFCAGADMAGLNSIAGSDGSSSVRPDESASSIEDNYNQHYSFPLSVHKPLLAAVNGPAVGLGFIAAMYCDVRFASDQARFGTGFAALGLIAEHGISWLLPRQIGMGNALDLLYSARVIPAQEAQAMGFVQRVVPHDELMTAVKEYAQYLGTRSSPRAMSIIKRLVWDAQFTDLSTATQAANREMVACFGKPDFKEGLDAFAQKRSPNFAGISATS